MRPLCECLTQAGPSSDSNLRHKRSNPLFVDQGSRVAKLTARPSHYAMRSPRDPAIFARRQKGNATQPRV